MAQHETQREKRLALLGLALALFLVSLDQTIVGTAMPKIIAELNGFELYAWVTTIYLLVETAAIPIIGKLGDIYGRKWLTVIGVAVFLGGSMLCGIAMNMPMLIAFRGLQGLGAGILLSTIFTLIADIFPDPKDRARYQGMLFSVFALSSVVGPVLGGWITDTWSWRWVFYINVPLGILSLVVLPIVLPQSVRRQTASIDYFGALTIIIAVVSLLLSLETVGAGASWSSPLVIGGFSVALVGLVAFLLIEQRVAEPIIPLTLFRNRTFSAVVSVVFMQGIAMFGVILYIPLFVQAVLGQSASASGQLMTPMVIALTGMNMIVGQLIARFGRIKLFLIIGTGLMSVVILLLTTLTPSSNPLLITGYLALLGIALGMGMPVTTLAVQASVDRKVIGVATSATQFVRTMGSTLGTALIGTIVTGGYLTRLMATIPQNVPAEAVTALHTPNALVDPKALQGLTDLMSTIPNGAALTELLLDSARNGLSGAIQSGMFLMLAASVIAFACSFAMANLRLDGTPAPVNEHATEHSSDLTPIPAHSAIGD
jgi:EmrB/QacA subfamily drug resistance transporter